MSDLIPKKTWTPWYPEELDIKDKKLEQYISEDSSLKKNTNKIKKIQDINKKDDKNYYEKGFSEGYKIGYKKGIEEKILEVEKKESLLQDRMLKLINNFESALESFDTTIVSHLIQLVLQISKKIIGDNPIVNNAILLKKIKQMIKLHPVLSNKPKLKLNPNDKSLIEKYFSNFFYRYHWSIIYDDNISQGGCILESENINLDATNNLLWKQLWHSNLIE